jgi:hypothetical protein
MMPTLGLSQWFAAANWARCLPGQRAGRQDVIHDRPPLAAPCRPCLGNPGKGRVPAS